jgi:hypothetical protein
MAAAAITVLYVLANIAYVRTISRRLRLLGSC